MPGELDIAEIRISDPVERKINEKHHVTAAEVREALVWRQDVDKRWEEHPTHGRRLVVLGTTYAGRQVLGWLIPVPGYPGAWILKTARAR